MELHVKTASGEEGGVEVEVGDTQVEISGAAQPVFSLSLSPSLSGTQTCLRKKRLNIFSLSLAAGRNRTDRVRAKEKA